MRLVLPYPVSANRYWRSFSQKNRAIVVLSPEAKAYKQEVGLLANVAGLRTPFIGRVNLDIKVFPHRPKDADSRIRKHGEGWDSTVQCLDIDNALKVLIDSLKGIAYVDDAQVWKLQAERMEPDGQGRVEITITEIQMARPQIPLIESDDVVAFCVGKERFESADLAIQVANRTKRGRTYAPYHCNACHGWHVGNPTDRNKAQRLRLKRGRSIEDEE